MPQNYPYRFDGKACYFVCWATSDGAYLLADDIQAPPITAYYGVLRYRDGTDTLEKRSDIARMLASGGKARSLY